jgi:serine/threonine-protein kinase
MGTVYKGLDPALDRLVALKTIRLDSAVSTEEVSELKEGLVREAKAAGKLSHHNIVTIYDVGEQAGLQYIAMEYLSGYTLESFIKKKKELNYKIVAKILMQVCAALNYAHQKGIVHRDIKPANIMLLEDFAVKVMDFGIARLETSSLTQSNVALGTPHYVAPEQLEGKPADKRSDIFSLGVMIYEFLTGEKPFQGETISALMYSILNHTPPPPSVLNEKTPLVFDRMVSKAMAKNPEERYQDAEEIEKTLREFISSFVVTRSIRI